LIDRYGETSNTDVLITINNTWNGAIADVALAVANALDVLAVISPVIVEKNVPAHVGHAVKRPMAIPKPLKHDLFAMFLDLLF
jgi:isocitrate dehydrogenase